MKEKLKNKKVVYTIIGIVSVLLVALAVTYAYWLVTKTQTGENEISSACLDISISGEKNDITLTNQFPMSDEDGMKLVPYEFIVTNNCNTSVDYQVALEATGPESNAIKTSALKVALNDSISLLSSKTEVDTTISGAYESRVLGFSRLSATGNEGSSDTYSLRIWIDEDAPISEMNKTFRSMISVTIGQGIESPYEEDMLAYSILATAGGVNTIDEINQVAYDHRIISNGIQYAGDNEYYGTEYVYDEILNKYTLSGDLVQASVYDCRRGYTIDYDYVNCKYDTDLEYDVCEEIEIKTPINCGKYNLGSSNSSYSSDTLYEITDFGKSGSYVNVNTIKYTTPFDGAVAANEFGVYKTEDDLGDSYYFRGAPSNNYVQFGTYTEDTTLTLYDYNKWEEKMIEVKAGTPMYWRIVRINGDGTIRLAYDGTTKVQNGVSHDSSIGYSAFNVNNDNSKYVGYTYDDGNGNQVDSTIKGVLDTWYDTHLEEKYSEYIADSIFCNDRSEASRIYKDENWDTTSDPNAAVNTDIYYGAYDRITNKVPSLKCKNQGDRYTVADVKNGNGLLSNSVGLITVDEEMLAGLYVTNGGFDSSYYLYSGECYWTLSPSLFPESIDGFARNFFVQTGALWYNIDSFVWGEITIDSKYAVRPVINLKADVEFTGDGTIDNPYKIVTE